MTHRGRISSPTSQSVTGKTGTSGSYPSKSCARHSRRIAGALSLLLVTCAVIGAAPVNGAKLTDSKVQSYEERLAQIEKDMKNLQSKITTGAKDITAAIAEKQAIDSEVSLLLEKIDVTSELIAELEGQISDKENEITDKQAAYDRKYELFKERLRVTREEGQASYLQMLLGSESLSDFLSRVDRIGAMLEYDSRIMNQLTSERDDLTSAKEDYQAKRAVTVDYYAQLEKAKKQAEAKASEADAYLKKLQKDKASNEALEAENEKLRKELEAELEKYLKELEAKQNSKFVGGTFMWPVPLDYTYVSSPCGWRASPFTGAQEYHNGTDIPCPTGTDIYASNAGTVITATSHWSYGNYVMIDHGGGYVTLYAHNSRLLVKVGDKVTKGQVIAKAGSTGSSTAPHCHFTMYKSGVVIDPMQFFK